MSDEPITNISQYFTLPDEDPNFVDLSNKFKCPGCFKLLRNPYQTVCGHYLCDTCKDKLQECPIAEPECKTSAAELKPGERLCFKFDRALYRELSKLPVYCEFRDRGCKVVSEWRKLKIHRDNCDFGVFPCPYMQYGCEFKEIPRKNLFEHENHCKFQPENEMDCRFGCGMTVKVKDLKDHENQCKNVHIKCPLQDYGCSTIEDASRKEIEEHIRKENCHHFGLVAESFNEMNDCIEVLTKDLTSVSDIVEALKEELKVKSRLISQLQEEVKKLHQMSNRSNNDDTEKNNSGMSHHKLSIEYELLRVKFDEISVRLDNAERSSCNGVLMWKITDYNQKKKDAKTKKALTIYSPPFYSTRFGYKMCARAYINGDGAGKDTHFSLYFVLMKGEYDHLLKWPFQQKITLCMMDLSGNGIHVSDTFRPDPNSKSFKKPESEMNIASGCPQFMPIDMLEKESKGYLKDNQLLIKVSIDTTGLKDP